ncbi:MAG: cytosine permease [bacterium]
MAEASNNVNVDNGLVESDEDLTKKPLSNEDIMPTPLSERSWGIWDISALWIGMCITLPMYYVVSGMIAKGMNWQQAMVAVILGNLLIFIPLWLNGHAGTKYGIPFPVLIRSSFGIHGAHIPAIFRGLVACGWFGVQSWMGGLAIHVAMVKLEALVDTEYLWPDKLNFPLFSPTAGKFLGFLIFWGICVWIVWRGIESIRWLERYGAPFLILCFVFMFGWAWYEGGGFVKVLTEGMERIGAAGGLSGQQFWAVFIPALMSMVGYWATLSLNIPDFTRYAGSQSKQGWGQFIGLNGTMGPFGFVIAFITAGAFLIFMPQFTQTKLTSALNQHPELQQSVLNKTDLSKSQLKEIIKSRSEKDVTKLAKKATGLVMADVMDQHEQKVDQNFNRESFLAKSYEKQNSQYQSFLSNLPDKTKKSIGKSFVLPYIEAKKKAKGLWDPYTLLGIFEQPIVVFVIMVAFAVATLTTNMAANVVAPANSFSNLMPQTISFRAGGIITGIIGLLTFPWVLLSDPGWYLDLWLGGAASLLAPIGGIMIGDYFAYRKTRLKLNDLYEKAGSYKFHGGFNLAGIFTLIVSIGFLLPGWILLFNGYSGPFDSALSGQPIKRFFSWIYLANWIFGFVFSLICYWILAKVVYGQPDLPELDSAE